MLENKRTVSQGINYSRYIASWNNVGGNHYYGEQFEKWLKSNNLTDQEISDIRWMATCGKLELEVIARSFVKKQNECLYQIEKGIDPEEEP